MIIDQETAYQGEIGNKRAVFCEGYIAKKKEILAAMRADQIATVTKNGEDISCDRCCTYCCLAYMQASLQECEAIAYYLYQHELILEAFRQKFPVWRQRLRENGDIFKECGELWQERMKTANSEESLRVLREAEGRYLEQRIYCPFLADNACSIYEVRPFTCAALIATTPAEYCDLRNHKRAKHYMTSTPCKSDTSFYFSHLYESVLAFMPLVVQGILENGYRLLALIPGLEGLEETHCSDIVKLVE
jgi:Fe-S-cluster containining protein